MLKLLKGDYDLRAWPVPAATPGARYGAVPVSVVFFLGTRFSFVLCGTRAALPERRRVRGGIKSWISRLARQVARQNKAK